MWLTKRYEERFGMNKRLSRIVSKAIIGATLTAVTVIGAGQMASASNPMGTCATTATFTASGSCTVLAGETVTVEIKGGDGGHGGAGGAGGYGGININTNGGAGGRGGNGGLGGAGTLVSGSYTNSTDETVTLTFVIGMNGANGVAGAPGADGSANNPNANPGQDGEFGGMGQAGTDSSITFSDSFVVTAMGGTGAPGGTGGTGGTGATGSTPGTDGVRGLDGARGTNGSYSPNPLSFPWSALQGRRGTPQVVFSGTGVPATTTTAPAASTTVPVTTTAPLQLPATGNATGPTAWVTLLVLASGASLVVLARRRVVH
jgi:hypothetical protein